MKIVFEDEYTMYRIGMELLLMELFAHEENLHFMMMDKDTVTQANIIIKKFVAGESFLCQPLLKTRAKNCLVVGVYEGHTTPDCTELPLCISDIVFINRVDSPYKIKAMISSGWQRSQLDTQWPSEKNCLDCRHQTLTPQQVSVATHFFRGEETHTIARKMHINCKTVSSHKYTIMKKFHVSTDRDLLILLHLVKRQRVLPNLFREGLNLCR